MTPAFKQNFVFTGKTYAFKDRITRLGGRWAGRTWVMPAADTKEQRVAQRHLARELHEAGVGVQLETVPMQDTLENT